MSAGACTSEDEVRYKLRPLPDVRFIGAAECQARRAAYEVSRRVYRRAHPTIESTDGGTRTVP